MKVRASTRRRSGWALGAIAVAATLTLAACGSSNDSGKSTSTSSAAGQTGSKLIIFGLSFPCGLNDYATNLCKGVKAAASNLPAGYKVEIKTGINYGDTVAYNSLIQNSLQLNPAGLIIFPNGPAAQVPILKQACAKGVKVIIIDSPATGLKCQSSFIGANHHQLGVMDGKWLVDHPSSSKEVGIVSLPPGQYASNDARVKGFTTTVTAAGYKVVATAITDLSLDTTRTQVTNMVTAHPKLGAVFSANGPMGQGTAQALKGNRKVLQLSLDGFIDDVRMIVKGDLSANAAQNPYRMGKLAVEYMAKVIQGQKVPPLTYTPAALVDKTNAKEYIATGGLR
jgi:ABC-type sugar transport system substrate-binding protein